MPARKALVTQHLEGLSRKVLEDYSHLITDFVKERSGVYALYKKDKVYYVGLAGNLRLRLKQHLKDKHKASWDRFSVYLTIEDKHMRELEALMIHIVNPTGNKQVGKFAKSEDLKKRFARAYKAHHSQELDNLTGKSSTRVKKRTYRPKIVREPGQPQLGPYLDGKRLKTRVLRAKYKNKTISARVLKDGQISFSGERYRSPSSAARAAIDTGE